MEEREREMEEQRIEEEERNCYRENCGKKE
jgi:hypothetical protein